MKKFISLTAALITTALLFPSLSPAQVNSEHQMPDCQAEIRDLEIAADTADLICGAYSPADCDYARDVVAEKARAVDECLKRP